MTRRAGSKVPAVAACLILFACSGGPTVELDTPSGLVPLNAPAPAMPGGLAAPPPGLESSSLPGSPPGSLPGPPPGSPIAARGGTRDGSYTGTAAVLDTGGGLCTDPREVTGFVVRGNSARFGGFRGSITSNGGLQMFYGQDWITGQFEGATFQGRLNVMGRFGAPGCSYMLTLARTGP